MLISIILDPTVIHREYLPPHPECALPQSTSEFA